MREKTKEKICQFFHLAYQDNICLHFRVGGIDTDFAQDLVKIIGSYNQFDPARIKGILTTFRGKVSCYEIGREYSPVIYVHLPYWTGQREYADGKEEQARIHGEKLNQLAQDIIASFSTAGKADECYREECEGKPLNSIRIWWD